MWKYRFPKKYDRINWVERVGENGNEFRLTVEILRTKWQNRKTENAQSHNTGHWLLPTHAWAQHASAWAQQGSPSWVTVLLCFCWVLRGQFRTSKTNSFDAFHYFLCLPNLWKHQMNWVELGFLDLIKLVVDCSRMFKNTLFSENSFSQSVVNGLSLFTLVMICKKVLDGNRGICITPLSQQLNIK